MSIIYMNIEKPILDFQNKIYGELNSISRKKGMGPGRLGAIPAAGIDVFLSTVTPLLKLIQAVAYTVFQLVGCVFSKSYTFKNGLFGVEMSFRLVGASCGVILLAPIKLIHQIVAGLMKPDKVNSIDYNKPVFG